MQHTTTPNNPVTYTQHQEPRVQRLGRDILLTFQFGGDTLHHALEVALLVHVKTCFKDPTTRHGNFYCIYLVLLCLYCSSS